MKKLTGTESDSFLKRLFDFSIIKRDWFELKKWFKSSDGKKNYLIILLQCLFLLFFLFVSIILPMINNEMTAFSALFTQLVTIPVLLIVIPITPWFVMFYVNFLWVNEKQNIKRFSEFSNQEILLFIRSRLVLPLFTILLIDSSLIIIATYFLFFYSRWDNLPRELQILQPLEPSGLLLYFASAFIITIFYVILLNYHIISHANYLRFIVPSSSEIKTNSLSTKLSQKLDDLRSNYMDILGIFISLLYYYFILIISVPIIISLLYSYFDPYKTVIWFWAIIWDIILVILTCILWKKTPTTLRNIPKSRYTLPSELENLFMNQIKKNSDDS